MWIDTRAHFIDFKYLFLHLISHWSSITFIRLRLANTNHIRQLFEVSQSQKKWPLILLMCSTKSHRYFDRDSNKTIKYLFQYIIYKIHTLFTIHLLLLQILLLLYGIIHDTKIFKNTVNVLDFCAIFNCIIPEQV